MGNVCECQKAEIVNEVSLAAPVVTKGSKGKGATGSSSSGQKASGSKAASSNSSTVVPQLTEDDLDTEDEKDDDVVEEMPQPSEAYMSRAKNRQSVSAEAYGEWNKRKKFVAPVYPKTAEQKERITKVIESSFLFSSLDIEDLETVINAFQEVSVKKGTVIIRQGDDGDRLYLIETGEVDVMKKFPGEKENKFLCKMHPGDAFGELALMYNAPRAATVIAADDMLLWALDRDSFTNIVRDAAAKKREIFEESLKEVRILEDMDPYERSKLSDALRTATYEDGDVIIKEGETGDTFYILLEGAAEAIKNDKVVMEYKKGGFFGELALLKDQPRAATVVAKSHVQVAYMDRKSFKRLLGPVEQILMRNQDNYRKAMKQLGLDTKYLDK
ncbi:cAMP-dependent protein kinase regulatory subunit [Toxoplasma gondii ME49]|uniref:cAMP-dependent protein kinase regulatory subunit n=20 Tax=Toxoplasma gondii TaxID=5811 RepID=A0A0F7UTU3_TOXGV|nr:cAMP-dependent protein kinase regulatory subunit [Toxoplasma gondii ME49]AAK01548.1 cAMP-dependent protein kinase regulatory subunit [Toxoplasma gondii]EPR60602.1 cAMP-dependent protein kinase regulatory subunit [Toxoplasma gondii GT1]ESS31513.1 cAMP-dependent protein kinase regulatory subunit [Toxoplasma gondii VEG]KFG27932.1 cAMP-dependent protein kinase regulatory subunit [Toxoplasma gondii p89]KFH04549.1 cAMP-dependent protein kinase regulatory subunit [Toxoplasma gondii VAND]PUA83470.|eukprot:XP_018637583.1 cAMP-dependent protein kinase regulatory subunit [Toxoplasma gondii ME49]